MTQKVTQGQPRVALGPHRGKRRGPLGASQGEGLETQGLSCTRFTPMNTLTLTPGGASRGRGHHRDPAESKHGTAPDTRAPTRVRPPPPPAVTASPRMEGPLPPAEEVRDPAPSRHRTPPDARGRSARKPPRDGLDLPTAGQLPEAQAREGLAANNPRAARATTALGMQRPPLARMLTLPTRRQDRAREGDQNPTRSSHQTARHIHRLDMDRPPHPGHADTGNPALARPAIAKGSGKTRPDTPPPPAGEGPGPHPAPATDPPLATQETALGSQGRVQDTRQDTGRLTPLTDAQEPAPGNANGAVMSSQGTAPGTQALDTDRPPLPPENPDLAGPV
jgi:hypothetical protein